MEFSWSSDRSRIDWDELSELYRIAPLGNKSASHLHTVYANSQYFCFVYLGKQVIGAGRALSDGLDTSYLCDIVVHPEYQGLGLGKQIVLNLVKQSRENRKIILYANPGKEGFYAKLGFKLMNTAMAIFENEEEMIENGVLSE